MKQTELENAVLGFVWRDGPCSAYAVQGIFEIVSTGWSSSPGSIYPLLARLERSGLLVSTKQDWGKRVKTLFEITERGRDHVREWAAEVPEWMGRAPIDPIRTKAFFQRYMKNDRERLNFIATAESTTKLALKRLEDGLALLPKGELNYDYLAQRGGIYQLQARLDWLAEVRATLTERHRSGGKNPKRPERAGS